MKKVVLLLVCVMFASLSVEAQGVKFESGTWDKVLAQAKKKNKVVFVDVYTTWCGPCKVMSPTVEALGKELVGQARILKIDVDKNEAVANLYRNQSVPTLMIFKKGEIVWRTSGVMEKGVLLEQIKKFID